MYSVVYGCGGRDQWTEVLSSEPRISIVHNFLSKEECEYLINCGRPHMTRSLVADPENLGGPGKISSARTSTGMFLSPGLDKVTRDIEKRISDYTSLPVGNGEGIQVIHYEVGQKFEVHRDYYSDEKKVVAGSQRAVTVLMYLSDVEEGGETFFPQAKGASYIINSSNVRATDKGIFVRPKMGDALVFWNTRPDGSVDPLTSHGSLPVIKGEKWACTMWMHDAQYKYYVGSPLNLASAPSSLTSNLAYFPRQVPDLGTGMVSARAHPPHGWLSTRVDQTFKNPSQAQLGLSQLEFEARLARRANIFSTLHGSGLGSPPTNPQLGLGLTSQSPGLAARASPGCGQTYLQQ